jgi:hypothetical protein
MLPGSQQNAKKAGYGTKPLEGRGLLQLGHH